MLPQDGNTLPSALFPLVENPVAVSTTTLKIAQNLGLMVWNCLFSTCGWLTRADGVR